MAANQNLQMLYVHGSNVNLKDLFDLRTTIALAIVLAF